MGTIEHDICKVFSESVKIRIEYEKEDRNVRDIVYNTFSHFQSSDVPLFFLSAGSYNHLLNFRKRDYDPNIGVYTRKISGYNCIKHIYDGGNFTVYVLNKERFQFYTLRGFMDYLCFSFLPKEFDLEEFKKFILTTYIKPHNVVEKFSYPILINI